METYEISERYIAPCFVNGLEAYDGELYFVKFIINPEEDDSEPGVILGRSFLRLAHRVVNFELPLFICKTGKRNHNKKSTMENLNLLYQDIGPSLSAGSHLSQEEAEKEALAVRISQKFALLEEERPVIKIMAYTDKYKKILDEIWRDKVELDGKTVKEEEDAVKRIKGEALKEKVDHGAFIFPIKLEGKVNKNALAAPGVYHQTYRAVRFDVLRTTESDSDDEEEYVIKRNRFGAPIYGLKPAPYLNCTNLEDRSSAIQRTPGTHDGEAGSSRSKHPRQHEIVEEVLFLQVYHEFLLWEGCCRDAKSRYNTRLAQLLPRHIYSPCIVNCDVLNQMGCDGEIDDMLRIRVREAGSDEEIFTFVAWIGAFNINEPIYAELFHEFYSTYEFDEVCAGDELQSKKIIRFRLGGLAHNLTLLEFSIRLRLYQVTELEEEGFNVYFERGLRSDEYFNAQSYWLSISREEYLSLSQSHTSTIGNPILRVIHKMITYGLCQRTTGDLDTTTLKDLIDSDGKLIPEDSQPGVPRFDIPRPPRACMQDLYDRMGRIEISQEAIEHMEYRQSYHWDRDNNCTIELDAFGFHVKDFLTHHMLLQCDSSGDLYPVTKLSTTPTAFLSTSASTWHQRLGHPGDEVLRSLVSPLLQQIIDSLHNEFDMTALGALNYFLDFGLQLYASATTSLVGYTDVDWVGCPSTRRTTLGYCVFLGDNLLSWSAKSQHSLSPVPKLNTVVLLTLSQRLHGFEIYFVSYILLYRLPLLFSVILLVSFICPPIMFNINERNTLRSTFTSSVIWLPLVRSTVIKKHMRGGKYENYLAPYRLHCSKGYKHSHRREVHTQWDRSYSPNSQQFGQCLRYLKDSKIVKAKGERKSLALKAKKESSDEECSTSGSKDEEYAMAVGDFKKFFKRRDRECPKPPKDKNQRAFVEGSWSDSGEKDDQ
uniref:Ribonuclease H-like domain-containing protein n=1 Tax=Tanacetum cinerariifolium TaxID=118510 RepID=A0A6L2LS52_TANCI|nr:ribonuclease H-like domain-containing protein [Tanacetum cinerariifolium]